MGLLQNDHGMVLFVVDAILSGRVDITFAWEDGRGQLLARLPGGQWQAVEHPRKAAYHAFEARQQSLLLYGRTTLVYIPTVENIAKVATGEATTITQSIWPTAPDPDTTIEP